jgi:N-formylglutamate deformylase
MPADCHDRSRDSPVGARFNVRMDTVFVAEPPVVTYLPPQGQTAPLVLASPHSGRAYPAEFVAAAQLDALTLRRSEDSFVDELFAAAPGLGAPLIAATFPRAFCDVNREAWELDPQMFEDKLPGWVNTSSARVVAGLGTIARVVASGEPIYRHKLRFAEAERRVRDCWQPFHAGLQALIAETVQGFGTCLLVDCHSMPSGGTAARPGADFIIGDAHGTACSPHVVRRLEALLSGMGYRVRRNEPYAGGYITRSYGRPVQGIHAVQIEIARSLYMDEGRYQRNGQFDRMREQMREIIAALAAESRTLLRS